MDRKDFYFKQPVKEDELNGAFDAIEIALWRLITDWGLYGIASGMVGAAMTPTPTMAVSISGPGYAYDQHGERIFIPAPWQPQPNGLDLSLDSNLVATAVSTVGHERWLSVFVKFARALSDPRVDGNSTSIYYASAESYQFVVVQSPETNVAPRPDLDPTMLLLFDVHIAFGQTTITAGDISTTRRQDTFYLPQTPVSLRAGNVQTGIAAMLQALNNHIVGSAGAHPDTGISSAARAGTLFSLAAGSVGTQLAAIQAAIDSLEAGAGGLGGGLGALIAAVAHKLTKDGTDSITGAVDVVSPGTFTIDAGAVEHLRGTLQCHAGSAVEFDTSEVRGTIGHAALLIDGGSIELGAAGGGGAGQLFASAPGLIQGRAAGAIAPSVAGGIGDGGIAGGIATSVPGGIKLGGGPTDFVGFTTPREKKYAFPIIPLSASAIDGVNWIIETGGSRIGYGIGGRGTATPIYIQLPNPHQGASLATVNIFFRVTDASGLPAVYPKIGVVRVPLGVGLDTTPQYLSATNMQELAGPHPVDNFHWIASGLQQVLTYVTDAWYIIDNADYLYYIVLLDQTGSTTVIDYLYGQAHYTNIPDTQFPC